MNNKLGLSLTGGGARGAYQAGVMAGLAELLSGTQNSEDFPFGAFSGVSAGAINAVFAASSKQNFNSSTQELCDLWSELTPDKIYRTDLASIGKIGLGWVRDVTMGAAFENKVASELLDSSPLEELISQNIDFSRIENNIKSNKISGVACTAFDYQQKRTVSFVESDPTIELWERPKRYSTKVKLSTKHVHASCAIPIIFEPVEINGVFYGDGSLRNSAPISPIIHLGSEKVIFIGVRYQDGKVAKAQPQKKPTVAEIFGTILNGLFFDTTDIDIERLISTNKSLEYCSQRDGARKLRNIPFLSIRPSVDIAQMAKELVPKRLPPIVDYLLRGLGDRSEYAELASYLLFDSSYTKKLVEIGYDDAIRRKEDLWTLLETK